MLELEISANAADPVGSVFDGLAGLIAKARYPVEFTGPIGKQQIEYIGDEDGIHARLLVELPEGVLGEVEDDTTGRLTALRVQLAPHNRPVETADDTYEIELDGSEIVARDLDGNKAGSFRAGDAGFAMYMDVLIEAGS